uniref:RING-type domain-containing protein n=1 Tax=Araucaria cunninghamii TaxID=56994 RepID=A0A0D6QW45_ARACU
MGTGWRRARSALGFGACASLPPELDDDPLANSESACPRFESRNAPSPTVQNAGNADSSRILQAQSPRANCGVDSPRSEVRSPRLQCQISPRHYQAERLPSPREAASGCVPPPSPRSPSRLNLIRNGIRSSKSSCPICLETMKAGNGHAIFTAECSHSFHFQCIASNVRHGNLICPVCRGKWKEVPWQAPLKEQHIGAPRIRHGNAIPRRHIVRDEDALRSAEEEQRRLDPVLRILDDSIASFRGHRQSYSQEPTVYDDDEPLDSSSRPSEGQTSGETGDTEFEFTGQSSNEVFEFKDFSEGTSDRAGQMEISLHPEVEAVAAGRASELFTVLVHIKAPPAREKQNCSEPGANYDSGNGKVMDPTCRAPIDLVTVLDVSGSMSGTKLSLLKRAMAFVISNLSPADRLAVVAFSSTAKRVFPLKRMVPEGQRSARRVIERLLCTGGTNIAEGLRKGAKVLEDRRDRNPVASIMLLSDGQDTYSLSSRGPTPFPTEEQRRSTRQSTRFGHVQIPVHAFGFGFDHDAATMHTISEESGGTFSFIQTESLVQEAFAQCIGGLLSVVVQDVRLTVSAASLGTKLKTVHAGSYETSVADDGSQATVTLGDLYAEEDRDILVELQLPAVKSANPMNLISVNCSYKDPVSRQSRRATEKFVSILRPDSAGEAPLNLKVEKQRIRLRTAQAIAEARTLADGGEMSGAQKVLDNAKAELQNSVAAIRTRDRSLYLALEAEITEIQARMSNKQTYERSGRAFVLSAQSSHFRQRATTRGESFENYSREYQTPSMADMVIRSQTLSESDILLPSNSSTSAQPQSETSAWRAAEKLAKVAMMRKSCTRISDLHGFENGGF